MTDSKTIDAGTLEVGVAVDTTAVDDALEKVDALGEATADLAPMVSIRNCRSCTFNIYPSRTTINENGPIWKEVDDDR